MVREHTTPESVNQHYVFTLFEDFGSEVWLCIRPPVTMIVITLI